MIIVYEKENPEKELRLNVIDTHTHLGKEEVLKEKGKDYRIIRPKDHLDLYEKLKHDVFKRLNKSPEDFAYLTPKEPKLFALPATRLQRDIFESYRTSQNIGWFADKIVTFPNHDILAEKTYPHFQRSNNYVLTRAQSLEYGSRLVPFCRVDPNNGDGALEETKRCIEYGARGLKLHPISEKWIDGIVSDNVIKLAVMAADNKLPILFDCQNYRTAQDIHQVAMEVKKQTKNEDFTIIVGHFGFDYQTKGMFEILEDENIKTETSGMRGSDCEIFYRNCLNLVEDWHLSTMYGTDHNYFSVPQASDHITFLFSQKAKDLGITFEHIRYILGLNALRMLKIYWPEKVLNREGIEHAKVNASDFNIILKVTTQEELSTTISKLCSISGVYFNTDALFDPSGINVYEQIYILNIFADIIDVKKSYVIQQIDDNHIRVSEITRLMDYASKITKILEEQEDSYPFTQQYLFDYLLHQKPK